MSYLYERRKLRDLQAREAERVDELKSDFYSHNNSLFGYFDRIANLTERVVRELYRKDEDGMKEAYKRVGEIRGAADSGRVQTQNYAKERLGKEAFGIPPWDRGKITREHATKKLLEAGESEASSERDS